MLLLRILNLNGSKLFITQRCKPNSNCVRYISTCILRKNCLKRGSSYIERRKRKSHQKLEEYFRYNDVFIQAIGSGAYGAPRSLVLQTHFHRILFNCGDGTKRIADQNDIDYRYYTRLFLTSCSWENLSGFPGHVVSDTPVPEYPTIRKIYGPSGLIDFMGKWAKFFFDPIISSSCFEIESEELNIPESLIVKSVALYSAAKESLSKHGKKYVLAYICTIPQELGLISTEKLVNAGVPPGPLVDDLKSGKSVTLPDGRIITFSDVSNLSYKSASFIVLEIPSVDYLESLISSVDFDKYKKAHHNQEENNLEVIVHLSPPEVMKDARYRQWVNSFSPSVSHMVINNRSSCVGVWQPIEMQIQLNQILPNVFPLHHNPRVPIVSSGVDAHSNESSPEVDSNNDDKPLVDVPFTSEYEFGGPTVQSNTALQYFFRPSYKFKSSMCPAVDPQKTLKDCLEEVSVSNSIKELKTIFNKLDCEKKNSIHQRPYPKLLFLGTGASRGSSSRNDSGILLRTSPKSFILLDCGKGTLNQLIHYMSEDELKFTLRHLKLIFISHQHQDHQIGLTSLLVERKKAFLEFGITTPPSLYILTSKNVFGFLYSNKSVFNLDYGNIECVLNGSLTVHKQNTFNYRKMIDYLQLENITTTFVKHCPYSFGVALEHSDGWKIVYSGDCEPSQTLVEIGRNCDLLIHEATYEDEMFETALLNKHSTVSQAVQVGRDMKAKFTILTHFAYKYNKIPLVKESIFKENVGIAFDFMKVTFEDLPYLRHLYPVFKEMFYRDFVDNEAKRYRRVYFREEFGNEHGPNISNFAPRHLQSRKEKKSKNNKF